MTDKEKIRAEIERRYRENKADGYSDVCEELWDILSFIDSMQEEPVSESINFEQELYKDFGQVKDFTLCMRIVKRFYDIGKKSREPVSEDLEEAGKKWLSPQLDKSYAAYGETKQMELTHFDGYAMLDAIEFGAQWQQAKDSIPAEYLEEAAESYAFTMSGEDEVLKYNAFIDGAQWQKEHSWKPADGDDLPEIDREIVALLDNGKVVFAHRPPEFWDGKNIVTGEVTRHYPRKYDKGGWNIPFVKYWLDVELPKEKEL